MIQGSDSRFKNKKLIYQEILLFLFLGDNFSYLFVQFTYKVLGYLVLGENEPFV